MSVSNDTANYAKESKLTPDIDDHMENLMPFLKQLPVVNSIKSYQLGSCVLMIFLKCKTFYQNEFQETQDCQYREAAEQAEIVNIDKGLMLGTTHTRKHYFTPRQEYMYDYLGHACGRQGSQ